ncbi:hypothetical protein I5P64_05835 [Serratia ureilytica]|uniref:hypothetical protein n=1 Tax=Serratia ureilytica TaxID=300181 RepID=UPI0018D67D6C|nr:hypothetical protein [Serratia ureilytica]MBH2662542.1 hypothetical protein [Serratia ureilytica]
MQVEDLDLARQLSLAVTTETVSDLDLKLSINFLEDAHALYIEQSSGKVLDWIDWFKHHHHTLDNKFSLVVSSKGKPPVVIGAAVYSYNFSSGRVVIHMIEHFKRVLPDSDLNKRMGFVALTAAYVFAKTSGAAMLEIANPLRGVVSYYEYLGFTCTNSGTMEVSLENLKERLDELKQYGGEHAYQSEDYDE